MDCLSSVLWSTDLSKLLWYGHFERDCFKFCTTYFSLQTRDRDACTTLLGESSMGHTWLSTFTTQWTYTRIARAKSRATYWNVNSTNLTVRTLGIHRHGYFGSTGPISKRKTALLRLYRLAFQAETSNKGVMGIFCARSNCVLRSLHYRVSFSRVSSDGGPQFLNKFLWYYARSS